MKPLIVSDKDFVAGLSGAALDVSKLAADARLKGVAVKDADLDGDGKISGEAEARALFAQLDAFDRDPSKTSLRLIDGDGRASVVRNMVQALADAGGLGGKNARQLGAGPRGSNDDLLYVGLRDASVAEKDALAAQMSGDRKMTVVGGTSEKAFVAEDGKTYDLTQRTGIDSFVKDALGLGGDQAKAVAEAIESNPKRGRDELAQIAQVWVRAEQGGRIPSRLSISGHHSGGSFWGEKGMLDRDSVFALAAAMPQAAAQVEDIHLSACYCQGRAGVRQWIASFPNARTILAYEDGSPSVEQGSAAFQQRWERASRGDQEDVKNGIAGAVVWTRSKGFQDGRPEEKLADLEARRTRERADFDAYFKGDKAVGPTEHARTPLRGYYATVTELAGHSGASAADRKKYSAEVHQTIRLIYFDKIAPRWAEDNAALVKSGYAKAGLTPPDFAKASRKDAVKAVDDFLAKTAGSKEPEILELRRKLQGLRDLDSNETTPLAWI